MKKQDILDILPLKPDRVTGPHLYTEYFGHKYSAGEFFETLHSMVEAGEIGGAPLLKPVCNGCQPRMQYWRLP